MSQKKKYAKKPAARRPATPSRHVRETLDQADKLFRRGRYEEGQERVDDVLADDPQNVAALRMLVEASAKAGDVHAYQCACERLYHLMPRDPNVPYMLLAAYFKNGYIALALDMARRALGNDPTHAKAADTRRAIAELEPLVKEEAARLGLDGLDELELAGMHDRVRAYMAQERFTRARDVAQKLIARRPDFTPAYNNAAESAYNDGALNLALQLTTDVLARDPDNYFALANTARFLYLLGSRDEARAAAGMLQMIEIQSAEAAVKHAEVLAMLGDDAAFLAACEKGLAFSDTAHPEDLAMLHHHAAVACCRQGRESAARDHWQAALRAMPTYAPARENLDDLTKPVGKRHGPWSFELFAVMPRKLIEALSKCLPEHGNSNDQTCRNQMHWFLELHPEVNGMVPLLIVHGHPQACKFALKLAALFHTPCMLNAVRAFAVGEHGSDDLRLEAVGIAQRAGLFPDGVPPLWLAGTRRANILQNIEIHSTPNERTHAPGVLDLIHDGVKAHIQGDAVRGEKLLRRALAIDPNDPVAMNNLATICADQGRTDESEALSTRLHALHPDYLFGRTALASLAASRGDTQRAHELLDPLMERTRLHVAEAISLCMAQFNLSCAESNQDHARNWLATIRQIAPDHPVIPTLAAKLDER